MFAVGQPFLEDLVTAQLVGPDGGGEVTPIGAGVEIDVEGGFAEGGNPIAQGCAFGGCVGAFDNAALAGHDCVACPEMPPPCCQCEIVAGHVAPVDGGGHGKGGDLRAQGALGNAGYGRVRVEQPGQFTAPLG